MQSPWAAAAMPRSLPSRSSAWSSFAAGPDTQPRMQLHTGRLIPSQRRPSRPTSRILLLGFVIQDPAHAADLLGRELLIGDEVSEQQLHRAFEELARQVR